MDIAGVRVLVAPGASATALGAVTAGVFLGTCFGLVLGLHVNSLALLLAAAAPSVPGPPQLVAFVLGVPVTLAATVVAPFVYEPLPVVVVAHLLDLLIR